MEDRDVKQALEELEDRTESLNSWELSFYLDMEGTFSSGGSLSAAQREKLMEIHRRATEPRFRP